MIGRDDFAGSWILSRQIVDRHGGQDGRMDGRMVLAPQGDDMLQYAEMGEMRLDNGPVLQASRSYLWRFAIDRVVVTFADGAAFHSFVPKGQAAGTDHPCGDDFYRVAYDFTPWPHWTATWDVSGPRKDYTSVSRYQR